MIGELPEGGEPSFAQSRNVSSRNIEVTMARDVTDEERARIAEMMAELEFSDDPKVDYRRLALGTAADGHGMRRTDARPR